MGAQRPESEYAHSEVGHPRANSATHVGSYSSGHFTLGVSAGSVERGMYSPAGAGSTMPKANLSNPGRVYTPSHYNAEAGSAKPSPVSYGGGSVSRAPLSQEATAGATVDADTNRMTTNEREGLAEPFKVVNAQNVSFLSAGQMDRTPTRDEALGVSVTSSYSGPVGLPVEGEASDESVDKYPTGIEKSVSATAALGPVSEK